MAKSRKNHQRSWQSRPLKILPLNTSASIPEEELKKIYESIIFWGGGAFVQDYLGKVSLEQVRNGLEFHKDGKDSVWKYSLARPSLASLLLEISTHYTLYSCRNRI